MIKAFSIIFLFLSFSSDAQIRLFNWNEINTSFLLSSGEDGGICSSIESSFHQGIERLLNPFFRLDDRLDFHIEYSSSQLEDLQQIKNCFDYATCGSFSDQIVDRPPTFRIHLKGNMSVKRMMGVIKHCPGIDRNRVRLGIDITSLSINLGPSLNLTEGAVMRTLENLPTSSIFNLRGHSTASFSHLRISSLAELRSKIKNLLSSNRIVEAAELTASTLGIPTQGFRFIYQSNDMTPYFVTNQEAKTIQLNAGGINNINECDFIRVIRHELEHVEQHRWNNLCNGEHNFNDHVSRERATHLNDAVFLNKLCPDVPFVKSSCIDRFRNHYIRYH